MPVLFLTGASGALGSITKSIFLEQGWSVAGFTHISDTFQAEGYRGFIMNATDETSVMTAFQAASMGVGKPDLIISTVGGIRSWKTIRDTPAEDVRYLLELNYVSAFLSVKFGMELMEESGGAIVLIGADTALKPGPKRAAYSSSKAAVIHLTQAAAEEGKEIGVSVNCVVPNTLKTKDNESWGKPEQIATWTDPSAIAETCMFLASPAGRQINGAILRIPNRV